ncbi:hypothetical protein GOBAR_AA33445 [Gossypium barbadense]|uniref:Uncharacterized protein n=1 Tax=Gossypium barbadense TaxID=3634 RepID=A0A2P5W826_GOSBA|nr:hypothetical protein GOBAR_AA33445 [Gossypium barbadense]
MAFVSARRRKGSKSPTSVVFFQPFTRTRIQVPDLRQIEAFAFRTMKAINTLLGILNVQHLATWGNRDEGCRFGMKRSRYRCLWIREGAHMWLSLIKGFRSKDWRKRLRN